MDRQQQWDALSEQWNAVVPHLNSEQSELQASQKIINEKKWDREREKALMKSREWKTGPPMPTLKSIVGKSLKRFRDEGYEGCDTEVFKMAMEIVKESCPPDRPPEVNVDDPTRTGPLTFGFGEWQRMRGATTWEPWSGVFPTQFGSSKWGYLQ